MSAVAPLAVSPLQLLIRCFAERKNEQWQAFSVEFGLAAQADSLAEVRAKLESMIAGYLDDIFSVDRKHAERLLLRKCTLSVWLKYHVHAARSRLRGSNDDLDVFSEALPLAPCNV